MSVGHQIARKINAIFFWYFAYEIAEQHHIAIRDLLLVDTIACAWGIQSIDHSTLQASSTGEEFYFHQYPLSVKEIIPSPVGHWSRSPQATSEPQSDISLPGIRLFCRTRTKCARLNALQAELVSCFGSVLKGL
ncbi:hypothetical protein OBBRIDRAFT_220887 [Obba rivulosa]|uniref:Uncharacterized protein n=1 Tax=Obba rivulosa TaxID=1052685 RepID=A0A8E2DL62_9APHY|nr:hypothetical protein OBBRIDRAFT_220887 [Obba rivulosa]